MLHLTGYGAAAAVGGVPDIGLHSMTEMAGAAGIHIENQVHPKRCGHMSGK